MDLTKEGLEGPGMHLARFSGRSLAIEKAMIAKGCPLVSAPPILKVGERWAPSLRDVVDDMRDGSEARCGE
jgi:hypothetical protein